MSSLNTLVIVPCGKRKIWDLNPDLGPVKAREAYIGPFSKKCKEYAERFYPDSWVILSAKYGFLYPDDIVPGPYNVTFNDPKTNPISVYELRKQAIEKDLTKYSRIIVLGGRRYVNIVKQVFRDKDVCTPLSRFRGLGVMMSVLKRAILSGEELDC